MLELFGSQFTIVLFLIIGGVVIYAIDKMSKEKMDNEQSENIFKLFGCAGLIVAIICVFLHECSHVD